MSAECNNATKTLKLAGERGGDIDKVEYGDMTTIRFWFFAWGGGFLSGGIALPLFWLTVWQFASDELAGKIFQSSALWIFSGICIPTGIVFFLIALAIDAKCKKRRPNCAEPNFTTDGFGGRLINKKIAEHRRTERALAETQQS